MSAYGLEIVSGVFSKIVYLKKRSLSIGAKSCFVLNTELRIQAPLGYVGIVTCPIPDLMAPLLKIPDNVFIKIHVPVANTSYSDVIIQQHTPIFHIDFVNLNDVEWISQRTGDE